MRRKDVGEAVIDRVEYPCKGHFYLPETDERGIVKNVIPGQKIKFRVYKKHKGVVYGNRIEVTEPSPLETREPMCAHFGSCGGCLYQTLPYETQLEIKTQQVKDLIRGVTDEDTAFDGIKGSPFETRYRNKIDLSFGDEYVGGPLTLGMHKMGTRYTVLDADTCCLMHPDLAKILICVREFCQEAGLPFYNKLRHIGYLRYMMLRRSETTGEILIVLAVSSQMEFDFGPMCTRLRDLDTEGEIVGIHLATDDRYADALIADRVDCLYGRDCFYETLLGLKFRITIFSFFQTNTSGAAVLYDTVRQYVREGWDEKPDGRGPVLYDLYCGTGTIAQILSGEAGRVYGIELVEEAAAAARENAALNGLDNCTFYAGDVFEMLPQLPEKPDFVVLDPPREGVHEKALKILDSYGITRMVYISCKASSFVTDMQYLRNCGWRVVRWSLVDLFPGTPHVELVTLLERM